MKFIEAYSGPEDIVQYEVLRPVFEWLTMQKWVHFADAVFCANPDHDDPIEPIISIRHDRRIADLLGYSKSNNHTEPILAVIGFISYLPRHAELHLENFVCRYRNNNDASCYAGFEQISIAHPDMFKMLRKYLKDLEIAIAVEKQHFIDDVKAATNEHEIPAKSDKPR